VLCVHSLPFIRRRFYEVFVIAHVPISIVFLGMLFWHCNNYLTSWAYLWTTVAIWLSSYVVRLFYLNWTNPWRMSLLVGEEAAVTVLPEDAIKVTIPTQMKWKPGQYVYLRMPGVSIFENHPFTIASLCSDDFPSGYGEEYRDMVLVFRPFGGFTKKVLENALDHGPWHTYRAFIDGPYGGMRRSLDSFDHVVLIAGGSGITALVSQLLDLIKRMRDAKAVTKTVHVIWALKRPDTMEWFKEELRICREYAPPDSVHCQFYITTAKRQSMTGKIVSAQTPTRPVSMVFHDKVNDMFQNIASNRYSFASSNRHSALIHDEAAGNPDREKELRVEKEDRLRPLPEAHLRPSRAHLSPSPNRSSTTTDPRDHSPAPSNVPSQETPHLPPHPTLHEKRRSRVLSLDVSTAQNTALNALQGASSPANGQQDPDQIQAQAPEFGFPSTPTEFQKNLMRFAFMPATLRKPATSGWSTEWGRPDIPFMLRELSREWTGPRAAVFVCGPPGMRTDVARAVRTMQRDVWSKDSTREEVFLHAENYAL
jgi:predicted ferric reductase